MCFQIIDSLFTFNCNFFHYTFERIKSENVGVYNAFSYLKTTYSATIQKVYSHWSSGARKGRMNGQIPPTLDPSLTQSMLMNSYSLANHDVHSLAVRNGKYLYFFLLSKHFKEFFQAVIYHLNKTTENKYIFLWNSFDES